MSIALDLGLFLRNSKSKLNLSLATQAVGFKLAFRVGSNSKTWVRHETLAQECGVAEKNLRTHTDKLVASGLLIRQDNKHDKRKNIYSFMDILINYHQMNDLEKLKVHETLGDEMHIQPGDNFKNTVRKRTVNLKNTVRKRTVNTVRKRTLSTSEETVASPATIGLSAFENSPKETALKKHVNQTNRESLKTNQISVGLITKYPHDFFPDSIREQALRFHSSRTNNPDIELLRKFEKISLEYGTSSTNWQITFEKFLIREKAKKTYEDTTGSKKRYDGQTIYN